MYLYLSLKKVMGTKHASKLCGHSYLSVKYVTTKLHLSHFYVHVTFLHVNDWQ